MKSPKDRIKNTPIKAVYYLLLIPLVLSFVALFIYGPSAVGAWVSEKASVILRHVRVEWFKEGNREIGIFAVIVSLIVIYRIFLSGKK